jgi:hypothetical protein
MALGPRIHQVAEMKPGIFVEIELGRPERKADNPSANSYFSFIENMGASAFHNVNGRHGLLSLLLTIKRNVYVSLKYADPSKISNFKRKN